MKVSLITHDKLVAFGENVMKVVCVETGKLLAYVAEVKGEIRFHFETLPSLEELKTLVKTFEGKSWTAAKH
jgi:membrane protease subunit (stomatin/prohibitin family)